MSDFVEYLKEVFQDFGPVSARKMFGGHGLFHQGLMIGLVADDVLYLKIDEQSKAAFIDEGCEPFMYNKGGKQVQMSYFTAPDRVFDDPDEAVRWASLAYDAALRSKK
tara:strand:+ start:23 stop:346 length:324 start_codon:yes stop_codon:yes gene_type:complete